MEVKARVSYLVLANIFAHWLIQDTDKETIYVTYFLACSQIPITIKHRWELSYVTPSPKATLPTPAQVNRILLSHRRPKTLGHDHASTHHPHCLLHISYPVPTPTDHHDHGLETRGLSEMVGGAGEEDQRSKNAHYWRETKTSLHNVIYFVTTCPLYAWEVWDIGQTEIYEDFTTTTTTTTIFRVGRIYLVIIPGSSEGSRSSSKIGPVHLPSFSRSLTQLSS